MASPSTGLCLLLLLLWSEQIGLVVDSKLLPGRRVALAVHYCKVECTIVVVCCFQSLGVE